MSLNLNYDALKDLGADLKVGVFTGFVFFLCEPSLVIVGDGAYHQSVLSFSHIAPSKVGEVMVLGCSEHAMCLQLVQILQQF